MSLLRYDHWFEDCSEHEDCIVHVGEGANDVGEFRTESHMHSDVDPAFRLNLDYPDADDRREGAAKDDRVQWALADDEAIQSEHFSWDAAERRRVAVVAAVKGLAPLAELAATANADIGALVDEAATKRWVDPADVVVLRADPDVADEQAAVERHREVLRQQLDPKQADPDPKAFADAQAFIALAADIGITEALAVADEVVAVPVDPKIDPKGISASLPSKP